ncbi:MAG: TIR domain-containing protein [Thermoanaerobaculia bacterium]
MTEDFDVFVSYSNEDRPFVTHLVRDLEAAGIQVWLDGSQVEPGDSLPRTVPNGIARSRMFMIVLSPDSVASEWVGFELDLATTREVEEQRKIIPVLYRDCEIPLQLKSKVRADFRKQRRYKTEILKLQKVLKPDAIAATDKDASFAPLHALPPVAALTLIAALLMLALSLTSTPLPARGPDVVLPFEETPEFRSQFASCTTLLHDDRYQASRRCFDGLYNQARTARGREIIEGMTTATYTGARQNREGLWYLCETYRGSPRENVRHRFRIHAHIRSIAETEGRVAARTLITELRSKCNRDDFSYVWAGIPLRKAEDLQKGLPFFADGKDLDSYDQTYLRDVIKDHPKDAFLDHAYYFLQDFETVIDRFPKSFILDPAYWSAGQQALREGHLERAVHYLETAMQRLEKTPLRDPGPIVEDLIAAYQKKGDIQAISDLRVRYHASDIPLLRLLGFDGRMTAAADVNRALQALDKNNSLHAYRGLFERNCGEYFLIAWGEILESNYPGALKEYEAVEAVFAKWEISVPSCIQRGTAALRKVLNETMEQVPEDLYELGFYLRDEAESDQGNDAFKKAAADIWIRCAKLSRSFANRDRALYLAASALRQRGVYEEAFQLYSQLYREHPDSPLAPHALAEIGWYHLFVTEDFRQARKLFRQVADDFPEHPAADNALNWLAYSHYSQREYFEAFQTYEELVSEYPDGRLAQDVGRHRVAVLEPVVDSLQRRKGIPGLSLIDEAGAGGAYVEAVARGSHAESARFEEGDVIQEIDGQAIRTTAELYHALDLLPLNRVIRLQVERSDEILETISTRVRMDVSYPPFTPHESYDGL